MLQKLLIAPSISMDDKPSDIIKAKSLSSMHLAIKSVQENSDQSFHLVILAH